ncbi:MAG: hypothetical protein ABIR80_11245 [Opitutaceae bacterium]
MDLEEAEKEKGEALDEARREEVGARDGGPENQTPREAAEDLFASVAPSRSLQAMNKTPKPKAKKKSAPKKAPRKDASQVALSIVERVTGGSLKPR